MSLPLKLDPLMLREHAAEVMVYFERHKIMEIVAHLMAEAALVRPENVSIWMSENIKRIAHTVYTECREAVLFGSKDVNILQLPGKYLYRVVVFGRRGSGRKTLARSLARRFNLVYIDAESLIYENLREKSPLACRLQDAFSKDNVYRKSMVVGEIINNRLLQMDALRQGWVLVNYPNNLCEIRNVLEFFKVPPNKFVYLLCPEVMAMRRVLAMPNLGRPQDTCGYLQLEMDFFNKNEAMINEYLSRRYETVLIDAMPCFADVKAQVLSKLGRVPYMIGFKN